MISSPWLCSPGYQFQWLACHFNTKKTIATYDAQLAGRSSDMLQFVLVFFVSFLIPESNTAIEQQFIRQLNTLRAQGCHCGDTWMAGAPVQWNSTLARSAALHARQMQRFNFFDHYSRGGKDIGQRARAVGYNWRTIGENLARGHRTVDHLLRDWQKSDTHCAVLMNPKFIEMGLARAGQYWVLHMGTPR